MLELAAMWSRNGHYEIAMSAVEEAMKTAHQRGDHSSVAKALLVLHHVVLGIESVRVSTTGSGTMVGTSGGRSNSEISAEEVLGRCLDRCESQGLAALAAQAVILLARIRSAGPLNWSQMTGSVWPI
jgi:hypothetical protein